MVSVIYTWRKHDRPESCVKCNALKGYTWMFIDETPSVLVHPAYGVVYDLLTDRSLAHGGTPKHCKCWVTYEIDDSDLIEDLQRIEGETAKVSGDLDSVVEMVLRFVEAFA